MPPNKTKVEGGNKVVFSSSSFSVAKLRDAEKQPDSLETWSKDRSKTIAQANRLLLSANRGYGDESQFQRDMERMLEQITVAARSLRSLVDQLNRNPESLIRGRSTQGP